MLHGITNWLSLNSYYTMTMKMYISSPVWISQHILKTSYCNFKLQHCMWDREIAQSLMSLSTKRVIRVCPQLDPLVTERWNSITVLLTRSHQCR